LAKREPGVSGGPCGVSITEHRAHGFPVPPQGGAPSPNPGGGFVRQDCWQQWVRGQVSSGVERYYCEEAVWLEAWQVVGGSSNGLCDAGQDGPP